MGALRLETGQVVARWQSDANVSHVQYQYHLPTAKGPMPSARLPPPLTRTWLSVVTMAASVSDMRPSALVAPRAWLRLRLRPADCFVLYRSVARNKNESVMYLLVPVMAVALALVAASCLRQPPCHCRPVVTAGTAIDVVAVATKTLVPLCVRVCATDDQRQWRCS